MEPRGNHRHVRLAIEREAEAFFEAYRKGLAVFVNSFRCYLSEDKAFFAILTDELVQSDTIALKPVAILPFFMLVFLTAFEVLVAFLQAYIFMVLPIVYISMAEDHH